MQNQGVTLPAGQTAGKDWTETLQNIVAYGAGRYFDTEAVRKIYKSNPTPYNTDEFGNWFQAGQPNGFNNGFANPMPLGIPLMVWLIGGGVLAFALLKD